MSRPITTHERLYPQSPVSPALAARGIESALWLAVLSAQAGGPATDALITDLISLHAYAGELRRTLDEAQ